MCVRRHCTDRFRCAARSSLNEANAIGTAALRARLLPAPQGSESLKLFCEYVQLRLDITAKDPTTAQKTNTIARSNEIQEVDCRPIIRRGWRRRQRLSRRSNGCAGGCGTARPRTPKSASTVFTRSACVLGRRSPKDCEFPRQPADEQIPADAMDTTRRRPSAASPLRSLQWHARFRVWAAVPPRCRSTPTNSIGSLTPKF
jgi:hypothetical protein